MYGVPRSSVSVTMRDPAADAGDAAAWAPGYGAGADAVPAQPDLTAFWRLLPSAIEETTDSGETILTLPAGTRFPGPERLRMLLRRRCYGVMHRRILAALEADRESGDGYRQFMATGTPGTGKTGFLYDLMYELACAGKTVVLWRRRALRVLLFTPRGVFEAASLFAVEQELADPDTWFLCKGMEPPLVNAITVLALSAGGGGGGGDVEEFANDRVMSMWVGPWSRRELLAARDAIYPAVDDGTLRRLYGRWGGIPRYVLTHARDPDQQRKLENALAGVTHGSLMAAGSDIRSAPEPYQRILHILVDEDCNWAGMAFGSPYICDRVCERLELQQQDPWPSPSLGRGPSHELDPGVGPGAAASGPAPLLEYLLRWSVSIPGAHSLRRSVFRRVAFAYLCRGGIFRLRDLSSPPPAAPLPPQLAAAVTAAAAAAPALDGGSGGFDGGLDDGCGTDVLVVPPLELRRWPPSGVPAAAAAAALPPLPPPGRRHLVILPEEEWGSGEDGGGENDNSRDISDQRCDCSGEGRCRLALDAWFVDCGQLHLIRVAAGEADVAGERAGSGGHTEGTGSGRGTGSDGGGSRHSGSGNDGGGGGGAPGAGPTGKEVKRGEVQGGDVQREDEDEDDDDRLHDDDDATAAATAAGEAAGVVASSGGETQAEADRAAAAAPATTEAPAGAVGDGKLGSLGCRGAHHQRQRRLAGGACPRRRCQEGDALRRLPAEVRDMPRAWYLLVPPAVFAQLSASRAINGEQVPPSPLPQQQSQQQQQWWWPGALSSAARTVGASPAGLADTSPTSLLYALEVPLAGGATRGAAAVGTMGGGTMLPWGPGALGPMMMMKPP